MTDPANEPPLESASDPRAELAAIVDDLRAHLVWMGDTGIRYVRRDDAAPHGSPAPFARASSGRPRPAFEEPLSPARTSFASPAAPSSPQTRPSPTVPPPSTPRVPPPPPAAVPPPSAPPHAARPPVAPTPAPATPLAEDPASRLERIRADVREVFRERFAAGRSPLAIDWGNPRAEVVYVGDAPDEEETRTGDPFASRGGQLFGKMIDAMGLARRDVYVTHLVKRALPPGVRRPAPDELQAYLPFVERQLRAVRPRILIGLGAVATTTLLRPTVGVASLRGKWQRWEGIDFMPTYHPNFLLLAPGEKGKAWEDLKLVLARLGRPVPRRS